MVRIFLLVFSLFYFINCSRNIPKYNDVNISSFWVWNGESFLKKYSDKKHNSYTKIYISIPFKTAEDLSSYQNLQTLLSSDKAEILLAENSWIYKKYYKDIFSYLKEIRKYNNYSIKQIEWIHFDIEPQALPNWKYNAKSLLKDYIILLDKIKKYFPEFKLHLDLPVYYDSVDSKQFTKIVKIADSITWMLYENVKFFDEFMEKELLECNHQQKNFFIAINSNQSKKQLLQLQSKLKKHKYFQGFAYHYWGE